MGTVVQVHGPVEVVHPVLGIEDVAVDGFACIAEQVIHPGHRLPQLLAKQVETFPVAQIDCTILGFASRFTCLFAK